MPARGISGAEQREDTATHSVEVLIAAFRRSIATEIETVMTDGS
jgi:hypothetical protein